MQETYGPRGLSILSVTGEEGDRGEALTKKWVRERGVRYAYSYDKGSGLARYFGVRGIPHAILIDPSGRIVWRGNPGQLVDETIELVLPGALTLPSWSWPEGSEEVEVALRKGDLPRALSEAQRVASDGKLELVAAIRRMIDGPVEAIREAYRSGDYPFALALAEQTARSHAGTPAGAEASSYVERIADNAEAQRVLGFHGRFEDLSGQAGRVRTVGDARRVVKKLEELGEDAAGTVVAGKASALAEELRAKIRRAGR